MEHWFLVTYYVSLVVKFEYSELSENNEEEKRREKEKRKKRLRALTDQAHTLAYIYIRVHNMITKILLLINDN